MLRLAVSVTALVSGLIATVQYGIAQYDAAYGPPPTPEQDVPFTWAREPYGGPMPGAAEPRPNEDSLRREDQSEMSVQRLPPHLERQLVNYQTSEPAGTIVVDTPNTYLYLVLGRGKAFRYGVGVGREGFTWAGTQRIARMVQWPDWHPPTEMIDRQPYLPRFMAGGPGNPLGARALYLGNTLYRIHGTNQPSTIGQFVSSGCIRLLNEDIEDLYNRVTLGTRVVVLPGGVNPGRYGSALSIPNSDDIVLSTTVGAR
jgi:lipoprotein-anchoring transpeptidase ErfK/SrfK